MRSTSTESRMILSKLSLRTTKKSRKQEKTSLTHIRTVSTNNLVKIILLKLNSNQLGLMDRWLSLMNSMKIMNLKME